MYQHTKGGLNVASCYSSTFRRASGCFSNGYRAGLILVMAAAMLAAGQAFAQLSVTPITWDVVGLDHNRPLTEGPELFPLAAEVCNSGPSASGPVTVDLI